MTVGCKTSAAGRVINEQCDCCPHSLHWHNIIHVGYGKISAMPEDGWECLACGWEVRLERLEEAAQRDERIAELPPAEPWEPGVVALVPGMAEETVAAEAIVMVLAERAERKGASFEVAWEVAEKVLRFAFYMAPERATTMFLFREVDRLVWARAQRSREQEEQP